MAETTTLTAVVADAIVAERPAQKTACGDAALVEAVRRRGDERAFRELYRRHTPRLYQLVLRLVGDAHAEIAARLEIIGGHVEESVVSCAARAARVAGAGGPWGRRLMSGNERERKEEDVLDGELAAAVRALPRERQPGTQLEERTVRVLRQSGWLGRRRRSLRAGWWAAGLAASIALFACGMATGLWAGARQTAQAVAAQQRASQEEMAAVLERTGTAYVSALARLAEANVDRGGGNAEARDVAVHILHQAANEVVRLAPNDPVATEVTIRAGDTVVTLKRTRQ